MTDLDTSELTEAFEYLDELRESGQTNMFGAIDYMVRDLCWSKQEAKSGFMLWMKTFSDAPVSERVEEALGR